MDKFINGFEKLLMILDNDKQKCCNIAYNEL